MLFFTRSSLYQLGVIAIGVGASGLPWHHGLNGTTYVDLGFAGAGLLALLVNRIVFPGDQERAKARLELRKALREGNQSKRM